MAKLEDPMDLYNRVMYPYEYNARKHDLGEDDAKNYVNSMSNVEFLLSISYALHDMLEKRNKNT